MTGRIPDSTIAAVVLGMAVTNFVIRALPIAVLSRRTLPAPILRWLSFVPVSVMGSLVASEVLLPGGEWHPPLVNAGLYAAVLTAVVFRYTRSFLGSTVGGMLCFVALSAVLR